MDPKTPEEIRTEADQAEKSGTDKAQELRDIADEKEVLEDKEDEAREDE